jgi:hypothetical protein
LEALFGRGHFKALLPPSLYSFQCEFNPPAWSDPMPDGSKPGYEVGLDIISSRFKIIKYFGWLKGEGLCGSFFSPVKEA